MLRVMFNSLFILPALGALLLNTTLLADDRIQDSPPRRVEEIDMSDTKNQIEALLKSKNQQIDEVKTLLKTAQDQGNWGSDDENETEAKITAAKKAAQCSMGPFSSKRHDQIKEEIDRMYRTLSGVHQKQHQPEQDAEHLGSDETVYVFLSSSMPQSTVRAYLHQIAAAKDGQVIPVMYGLVEGIAKIPAAADYFSRILQVDGQCQDAPGALCDRLPVEIRINPMLFKQYGITAVPSVVYVNGENWWSIQGDAALDYLLETINREASSPAMDELLTSLRRNQ